MATLAVPRNAQDAVIGIRRTTIASVLLLAGIAALISYRHMYELAHTHGEPQWTAALIPLSVDGMVVASSMTILLASRSGRRAEWLPWTLLIIGSLASLAANVAVAEPTLIGRLVAAWPSFAFVGAYEMLQGQLRASHQTEEPELASGTGGCTELDGTDDALSGPDSPGRRLQRQAWEWALQNRSSEGDLPPGHAIAAAHRRSPRWGRMVRRAGLDGEFGPT
jgi:hypothetical protein